MVNKQQYTTMSLFVYDRVIEHLSLTDAIETSVTHFVAGSRPFFERFFSGYSDFPLSSKSNTFKFQFDLGGVPN